MSDIWDILHDTYRYSSKTLYSQAFKAVESIASITGSQVAPEQVPISAVKAATAKWYGLGLSPATITKRLNCLGKMGVNVTGTKPTKKPMLKWWLKPQHQAFLLGHPEVHQDLKDWIIWTTTTGLRIEETLRLTADDFEWDDGACVAVTVPGLKTFGSQATLPLGEAARKIATKRCYEGHSMFDLDYRHALCPMWDAAMDILGVDREANPTATLKALRRNAARYLHVTKGMPLDMVRQYLRHEDIKTTMGYLALTGGYGTEEMKGYL